MKPFRTHEGVGVPLRRSNVDTDQILSAEFLKRITRTGYEDALFRTWRQDPAFVLNHDHYRNGSVLVAGSSFGIGSSREHAVWALMDYGFRAVIAASFGDIFRGNAGKTGLLTVQCTLVDVESLWRLLEDHPGTTINVDLVQKTIRTQEVTCAFAIDEYTRWRLLEGLDDIGLTLQHVEEIAAYESARSAWLPSTEPATARTR